MYGSMYGSFAQPLLCHDGVCMFMYTRVVSSNEIFCCLFICGQNCLFVRVHQQQNCRNRLRLLFSILILPETLQAKEGGALIKLPFAKYIY